ncbi:outer membrane protein assembly factor BamD [Desulfurispirillum indicum]|uniref:Outer membrane assembly lipoprotein YfiO n=1 Tax=Desulfurispirillum indicum (strain ATCC BAA-1389 / DSM 22839 / S5) TaxID=653733 RepID=E6W1J9_DESIS|nr:outer membrane protein assembly factor BamD [Desulfurispirillum indicum]ADU66548.1 outer membrane assembly lipoprotein YfiO [Desulfurispirillum indicum S5]UCZ55869.1 outer membrane protein assembly factor BamD [Desulfurispirillum indicum]
MHRYILLLLALLILSAGCAKKADPDRVPDLETAHRLAERGQYDEARQEYRGVMNLADNSEAVARIMLYIAHTYEKEGEWLDASIEYEHYLLRFPDHSAADDTMIRLMEMYMEQIRTIDRDVNPARKAYSLAHRFYREYQSSPRTGEVQVMEQQAFEIIAEHEAYILDFYLRTKKITAAKTRLERIERDDPDFFATPVIQQQYRRLKELQK